MPCFKPNSGIGPYTVAKDGLVEVCVDRQDVVGVSFNESARTTEIKMKEGANCIVSYHSSFSVKRITAPEIIRVKEDVGEVNARLEP